jgi:hypothetical protein
MALTAFRPRSASELVDAAFQLLRQDYVKFLTIMGIAYVPYLLAMMLLQRAIGVSPDDASVAGALFAIVSFFASALWLTVVTAAIVVAASDAYTGREVDVGRALRGVLPRVWGVLAVAFLRTLVASIGFLFFIIPGFYFYARYVAAPAALIVERRGALSAMGRSSDLTRDEKWRIFKTLVLAWIIFFLLYMLFAVAGQMAAEAVGVPMLTDLAIAVATILIYPLTSIVETLIYYDLRIRKEGYDIELMAREIGGPAEQPAY